MIPASCAIDMICLERFLIDLFVIYVSLRMLWHNIITVRTMAYKLHESGPASAAVKAENVTGNG